MKIDVKLVRAPKKETTRKSRPPNNRLRYDALQGSSLKFEVINRFFRFDFELQFIKWFRIILPSGIF